MRLSSVLVAVVDIMSFVPVKSCRNWDLALSSTLSSLDSLYPFMLLPRWTRPVSRS